MVATTRKPAQNSLVKTFDSLNPATDEPVGTFPIFGEDEVNETVARARDAAAWWSSLTFAERKTKLLAWKSYLTRYIMRLAEVVHAETGKPTSDAQLEIMLAIVHIDWAARNARKVLGPHQVRSGLVAYNHAATVEYHPLGVVGVIGPWNYPVFTPIGSIAYALAAGNAVVYKPSEFTPATGGWLVSSFAEVVPEFPVLQLVTGFGETGSFLARSHVDKIAFTGSTKTAKKVMAACAGNLTPMVAECGGKDAMLVAPTPTWTRPPTRPSGPRCPTRARPASASSGSTSRRSLPHLHGETRRPGQRAAAGDDREADYGPMTMPGQLDVIEQHIADAMASGGRAVVGGLGSIRKPYVGPVILADVPEPARPSPTRRSARP